MLTSRHGIGAALLLASACEDDSVLGEERCRGVLSLCSQDARLLRWDEAPYTGTRALFEIEVEERIAPSFRYDLPGCPEPYAAYFPLCTPHLVLLPAQPGAWVVYEGGPGQVHQRTIERLSSEGTLQETATFDVGNPTGFGRAVSDGQGGLALIESEAPPDSETNMPEPRVHHRDRDGYERSFWLELNGQSRWHLNPESIAFMGDGSLRARSYQGYPDRGQPIMVWAFEPDGRLRFEKTLASARKDTGASSEDSLNLASHGAATADDGYLFATRFGPEPTHGVALVDSGGELRWALGVGSEGLTGGSVPMSFAANRKGELAVSRGDAMGAGGVQPYSNNGDLSITLLQPSVQRSTTFTGRRVGYHSAASHNVVLSEDGDAYALTIAGERDRPEPLLCALTPGDAPRTRCAGFDLCGDGELAYFFGTTPLSSAQLVQLGPRSLALNLQYACLTRAEHEIAPGVAASLSEEEQRLWAEQVASKGKYQILRFDL